MRSGRGARVTFAPIIEISLDCHECRRSRRTVVMSDSAQGTYCTPARHPFTGRMLSHQSEPPRQAGDSDIITGSYHIEYEFEPFVDAKYPHRNISPTPTWSRIGFTITCPCGYVFKNSTQCNIVRPRAVTCQCGRTLMAEEETIPIFSDAAARD